MLNMIIIEVLIENYWRTVAMMEADQQEIAAVFCRFLKMQGYTNIRARLNVCGESLILIENGKVVTNTLKSGS